MTRKLSHAAVRRKGHQFERDLANFFDKGGIPAERNLEYQTGHKGDILLKTAKEFIIQAKNQDRPPFKKALEQAEEDLVLLAKEKPELIEIGIATAICKIKGSSLEESIVCLRLEDFLRLMKAYLGVKNVPGQD